MLGSGNTSIGFSSITIANTETTSEIGEIPNVNLNLTINGILANTNSNNTNSNSNSIPKTGIENTTPIIFTLIVFGMISYIQYKRYKKI